MVLYIGENILILCIYKLQKLETLHFVKLPKLMPVEHPSYKIGNAPKSETVSTNMLSQLENSTP